MTRLEPVDDDTEQRAAARHRHPSTGAGSIAKAHERPPQPLEPSRPVLTLVTGAGDHVAPSTAPSATAATMAG